MRVVEANAVDVGGVGMAAAYSLGASYPKELAEE